MLRNAQSGFTLIEIMVALVVISIGLGALLVATSQNIRVYQQLETNIAESWVTMQNVNLVRLGMQPLLVNQPKFTVTQIKHFKIHARVEKIPTRISMLNQIIISTRANSQGKYQNHFTYSY
ncbi:prepilin-type N-terminal cleavage/methylation domain-containing protein, partial [bacterium]|nr:prepilin-type N-terminal cleavage/methylation domain-containing protein [bacterium]